MEGNNNPIITTRDSTETKSTSDDSNSRDSLESTNNRNSLERTITRNIHPDPLLNYYILKLDDFIELFVKAKIDDSNRDFYKERIIYYERKISDFTGQIFQRENISSFDAPIFEENQLNNLRNLAMPTVNLKKSQIPTSHKDSINSIELFDTNGQTIAASCSDNAILLHTLSSTDPQSSLLFPPSDSKTSSTDEFNCLKSFTTDTLIASNDRFILLFDINERKLINKFKFNQDTINCIEGRIILFGDDKGEIKIVDVRTNTSNQSPSLTLKNTLKGHKNICFCLKFHPNRPNELFSGSFDCSIIKWDIRNPKSKLTATKDITPISNELAKTTSVHPMTPSFVHSLFFTPPSALFETMLMCGLENGLCLALDPNSMNLSGFKQIAHNRAVTQIIGFESSNKLKEGLVDSKHKNKDLMAAAGDFNYVEFVYLDENPFGIEAISSLKIDHGCKINCLKYWPSSATVCVADTSPNLTTYNLSDSCFC